MLLIFSWVAWASYQAVEHELTSAELAKRQSLARFGAVTLEEKFKRLTDIGTALATRVKFRELIGAGKWDQAISILSGVSDDFSSIERVFLTDPEGTETADLPALAGGVGNNFAYRDWYKGVSRDWQPYISHVYRRAAIPQRHLFAVAVPIKHDDGHVLGIMVLQISLQGFFSWTEDLDIGQDGIVYIVDSQGSLAYHPGYRIQDDIVSFSNVPAIQQLLQGLSNVEVAQVPDREEKQLLAYAPASYGWGVVVQQPYDIAFASKNRQLNTILLGYGLFLLLVTLIGLLVIKIQKQRMKVQADERVNKELEEQWSFFRKIIDIDRNMIFVKDYEGRFVLVNQAIANVFGTTKEDMVGKTNNDFIPNKALVEKFYQDEQEVIQNQQEKIIPEIMIRDVKGNIHWLQVVMQPLSSVDGSSRMVLGVSSDITDRIRMESQLRHNVERFEIIARATNDAIWDWDFEVGNLWWNESFKTLFGYSEEDGISSIKFWEERVHPADRERIINGIEAAINRGNEHWEGEYRFLRKDGSYAYVHDHGYIVHNNAGKAYRMLGSLTDISERHEQEDKIARLSRIRNILSEINYAIVRIRDREILLQEACRICVEHGGFELAWISLLNEESGDIRPVASYGDSHGYLKSVGFSASADSWKGKSLTGRAIRERRTLLSNNVETDEAVIYRDELLKRGFKSLVALPMIVQERSIGALSLYSQEANIFDAEEIELLNELVSDVTFSLEYLDKEDKVRFLAYYDALTGLSNRDLFLDRLKQYLHSVTSNTSAGVLIIDIERFSYINEAHGQEVGDQVLKRFSANLQQVVADTDYVARLASNTFAILLADIKNAAEIAHFIENKLLPYASTSIWMKNNELKISVRIGVAMTPLDGVEPGTLIKNAEAALKSAKQSGDKYLFYARDMNARVAEKLLLENKLRTALEHDEFMLCYQPKIDMTNDRVCGFEALIRWNSEEGIVPPDKFIPILEETGLILDVGQWVIRQATRDYQAWRAAGLNPPPVAVNISAIQLRQRNFVERIDKIIQQAGSEAVRLELEITETVIMEELEENIQKLNAIRERSIGISIDDFGTGYSSLRYMSRLPVTALKIDRSFTANLLRNEDDTAIVTAIIPLAHSLHLPVIAEGVETEEQLNLLRQLNCDQYQGYLFSPPVPAAEIEVLLKGDKAAR